MAKLEIKHSLTGFTGYASFLLPSLPVTKQVSAAKSGVLTPELSPLHTGLKQIYEEAKSSCY